MAVILLLLQGLASAAMQYPSIDAESAAYWDSAAVVYAEVLDVEHGPSSNCPIRLSPISVLTGKFDPAFQGSIWATARIRLRHTVIIDYPAKSQKVIVLLERGDDGKYRIPDAIIKFFPKQWFMPIFEVTGFDDPKVSETIENLRKLRGKQREEAEKDKAEQKPAAEKAAEKKSQPQNSAVK